MTISDELRVGARRKDPYVDLRDQAFSAAKDFSAPDEWLTTLSTDDLRTYLLLVAETLDD